MFENRRKRRYRWIRNIGAVSVSALLTAVLLLNSCDILSRGDLLREFNAPVADAGTDLAGTTGSVVTLDGSGSMDPGGLTLDYSWYFMSVPAGSAISDADISFSNTASPEFTPDVAGTYALELVVGNHDTWRSDTVAVVVIDANIPPVADAGTDQNVTTGNPVTLDGSASYDADLDPITYIWSFTATAAGSILTDASIAGINTDAPSFTPDVDGNYQLQLTVSDGTDSDTDQVLITSTGSNTPPVADAGADQNVTTGNLVNLDGTASSDPDTDPITYTWTFLSTPIGSAVIDASLSSTTSSIPSFTPDVDGTYELQLSVSDGSDTDVDSVLINATASPNTPPVADITATAATVVGAITALDGTGSYDPDGDPITCAWSFISTPVGSVLTVADITGNTTDSATFTPDIAGDYEIRLLVDDGIDTDATSVTINAVAGNTPPVADAGTDQNVLTGSLVSLDGSVSSDADLDPLTYAWTFISVAAGSALVDADIVNITSNTPSFTTDVDGSYELQLTVDDGTVTDTDTVLINSGNVPPVAAAGTDQNVHTGDIVVLTGTGSSDANGDILTYLWAFVSVPAGSVTTLANVTTPTPEFTPDVNGTYELQLTVDDGMAADSDTVVITASNNVPLADAGPDQAIELPVSVMMNASGSSDPDGDSLTYSWAFASVPPGSGVTDASLTDTDVISPSFIPDLGGTYILELTVDDGVDTSFDSVTIFANNPPTADAGLSGSYFLNSCISLDGSASDDPDTGDTLSYSWTFQTLAAGSVLTDLDIFHATTATPFFFPDVAGDYIFDLSVSDGAASDIASVTITVENTELLGEWLFNSGDAMDTGPYGNDGIVNNATLCEDRGASADRAFYFNGADSNIILGDDPVFNYTDVISLSCWIRPDDLAGSFGRIISKRNSPTVEGWEMYVGTDDTLNFTRGNAAMADADPAGLTQGAWHHVVFTWDPNAVELDDQFKFYLNGVHIAASVSGGAGTEYVVSSQPLTLGMAAYGAMYFFGAIDDVRLYHGILDQADVDGLYLETP